MLLFVVFLVVTVALAQFASELLNLRSLQRDTRDRQEWL